MGIGIFMTMLFQMGAIVEDVRTVFARKNDVTVYIPDFSHLLEKVGVRI